MPEKMNLVIKDVILEKWKSKIGYSFNYLDLDELEIIINQFENHITYLEKQLQQREDIINKAKEYISKHTQHDENGYVVECLYVEEAKDLLEILDNKGEVTNGK